MQRVVCIHVDKRRARPKNDTSIEFQIWSNCHCIFLGGGRLCIINNDPNNFCVVV